MNFVSALVTGNAGLPVDELVGLSECESEMTGPRLVFSDGHPWFTP
jgi:hypothetical protein